MHGRNRLAAAALLLAASGLATAQPERAAVSDLPAPGVRRVALPPQQFDGYAINRVFYDLLGGSGSVERDQALRTRIEALARPLASGPFNQPLTERAVAAIRAIDGLSEVGYTLYASERPGAVVLVISATLGAPAKPAARGYLIDGSATQLPVLYESADALLRLQLNVWAGAYADRNPWFGAAPAFTGQSPIALDPPGPGWTNWAESMIEYGLAGASRVLGSDVYVFGELTGMTSGATGQDLFRSDTRTETMWEKVYGGALWAQAAEQRALRLSVGRQNWQLNNGFLFSRYAAGANAGPNPALYLNPRTTYQMAVLAEARFGSFEVEFFDLDPAELKAYDSNTRFQGLRGAWLEAKGWDLGVAAYRVPESNTLLRSPAGGSVPRDGQRTLDLRAGHRDFGSGFNAMVEAAFQDNPNADVSARAWYAQFGHTAAELPWKPSLLYRYASFSGDKPNTVAYEAFDAPLSSGLDEWVQGVNFKKVVTNTNLNSNRVRLNLAPSDYLNLTLDYYQLWADVPLATGESNYGKELDLIVRWSISPRLFLLGVAGQAWPGNLIQMRAQDTARSWTTAQVSLFWGY